MFFEVAALVAEQGELVDRIENHVMEAQGDVEKGKDNLKKAEDSARKARKMKASVQSSELPGKVEFRGGA